MKYFGYRKIYGNIITRDFSKKNTEGFTILEILLAVTLGAVILSALYWSYAAVVRSTRSYRAVSDLYQTARIVLDTMAREISGAFQPLRAGEDLLFQAKDEWFSGLEADRLSMVTTTCLQGGAEEVGYDAFEVSYFRGHGDQAGMLLMLRSPYFNLEEPFEEGEEIVLAEGVRSLNFEYYDGEEWLETWDPEEQEGLPFAVRITIGLGSKEEKEPLRFSTVASLPMTPKEEEELAEE